MSAPWSVADVRAAGPDSLGIVADAVIQFWIDQADAQIDGRVFGDVTKYAGVQLTLHMMAVAGKIPGLSLPGGSVGVVGAVTGISVGQVSTSFASGASGGTGGGAADSALMLTKWGQEYVRVRDMKAGGPWLAGLPYAYGDDS